MFSHTAISWVATKLHQMSMLWMIGYLNYPWCITRCKSPHLTAKNPFKFLRNSRFWKVLANCHFLVDLIWLPVFIHNYEKPLIYQVRMMKSRSPRTNEKNKLYSLVWVPIAKKCRVALQTISNKITALLFPSKCTKITPSNALYFLWNAQSRGAIKTKTSKDWISSWTIWSTVAKRYS